MRWRQFLILITATVVPAAAAHPVSIGASMGMMFPSDRLVSRNDGIGATLLPGPSAGLHAEWNGLGRYDNLGVDATLELGLFQSREDARLRTQALPLDVALDWQATTVQEVGLRVRVGGGPVLVSTNLGATRTVLLGETFLGGQLRRSLRALTLLLDVDIGLLWQARVRNTIRARLVVLTP